LVDRFHINYPITQLPDYSITQLPNSMLLAGDVGGTKTRLGLFAATGGRPSTVTVREYPTADFPNLIAMVEDFRKAAGSTSAIDAACFGVAGPVLNGVGHLTNVPWRVDADQLAETFGIQRVSILNDLEALAHAVPVLDGKELHTLQQGVRRDGNIAVLAAGTGLGEALLHRVKGRYIPSPGEGGHADFAARNDREIALLRDLTARFGRASVEHVLSGPGLQNVYRVTHQHACPASGGRAETPSAAAISKAALERSCAACIEAMEIFVDAYGAEAGNLALRSLATGGVFVGGGIAPKILPALTDGRFIQAFVAKPPHDSLLSAMPVHVIINSDAGLVGAAVCARALTD
jgi:glucokinase